MLIPNFETYDYPIGGKMVVGRITISESYKQLLEDGDPEAKHEIKKELIDQMALYMLENKLVEFTYYDDPLSNRRNIAIRAYLAPDDQVKILRIANMPVVKR